MDLIIRNARLADGSHDNQPVDIGIENGCITAIAHRLNAVAEVYDAKGCLACPGLIETHIHLDKSRIIDRCVPQDHRALSPVVGVTPLKQSMSVEDVRTRAARTLKECVLHGTTRMPTTSGRLTSRYAFFRRKDSQTIPEPTNCWSKD